jgi:hypothetical protein
MKHASVSSARYFCAICAPLPAALDARRDEHASFIVRDANWQAADHEARRIATNIAKLPELLRGFC